MVLHVTMRLYGLNSREGEKKTGKKKAAGGGHKIHHPIQGFYFQQNQLIYGQKGREKTTRTCNCFLQMPSLFFPPFRKQRSACTGPKILNQIHFLNKNITF